MSKRAAAPSVSGMIQDDDHFRALADSFHSAALGVHGWHVPLSALAEATGSRSGELIGLGSSSAVPFNLVTNMDPGFQDDFIAAGGGDPVLNARVRAGSRARALTVLAEADYLSEEEYRSDPLVQHLASRWDLAYSCLTALERHDDLLIGLAVLRSRDEGHISSGQREVFASVASHARAAIRTHLSLEGRGAELLAGAMESLSMVAFVCDGSGRVGALTPSAEALVTSRRGLQLTARRLRATHPEEGRELDRAIEYAAGERAGPGEPAIGTVILRGRSPGERPVVLDVVSLPARPSEFGFAPKVLVVARGQAEGEDRKVAIMRAAYDLTPAETDIAMLLSKGRKAETIAAHRRVSVGTVRTQIKGLLAKLGLKSQLELVARVNQL